MRGNDCQLQAEREQEEQYKLSGDIVRAVNDSQCADWPPNMWENLVVKYLHSNKNRATLGALGLMAGYEI